MTGVREQQFRKEAIERNFKLPPYICAHGLRPCIPYTSRKEEVSYDINFENVELAIDLIKQYFTTRKTINPKYSSYWLKHLIEKKLERYISNSELIIAMLTCDYQYKQIDSNSPNCYFNVSSQSIKKLRNNLVTF